MVPHEGAFDDLVAVLAAEAPAVEIGPGCRLRNLPTIDGLEAWLAEIDAGCSWPVDDEHELGESYYVLAGEVIEGDRRFGTGTWVTFAKGSVHRPRSDVGARLVGVNPIDAASPPDALG